MERKVSMASGIAIISHADCVLHNAGPAHPEQPRRIQVIQDAFKRYPFKAPVTFYEAPLATLDQLSLVHDKTYIEWLTSIAPEEDLISIDDDTYMNPYTLNAAYRAAGSVPFAVDLVMKGIHQAVFCNVRPPGHHAENDRAMGFCFFNNVAVGAAYAMKHYGLERIAIVDFDLHRGNGTQVMFQQDKRVLYCSSFAHPLYPGYEEELDNSHILSVPLLAGTKGDAFREKVKDAWFEKIAEFKPQLIFFSAGFDAHQSDPLSSLGLQESDYVWLTTQVANLAREHCNGKIVSVLEGGYNLNVLAQCVPAHVNALVD
jgi:acetoin utilization deacetylase AcuC-like enzyme